MEDLRVGQVAHRGAAQHRRGRRYRCRPRRRGPRRDERQIVGQAAVGVEAVLHEEEGELLAVRQRAEIHRPRRSRHVQRIVDQHVDIADRAVGGDLVVAQRVVEQPTRPT